MKRATRNTKVMTTMMAVLLVILLAASGMTASPTAAADDTSCVDFEDLPLGAEYSVGDTFTDSGADMEVQPHQWDDGQWTDDGLATVDNGGYAGGSGQDMWLFDVNLRFDFGGPCEGLSLLFGAYGGNLNIEINDDFRNFNDFHDIDGSTIGGVDVAINDSGDGKGSLTLSGNINQNSFAIGGQEFCIDDVCSEVQPAGKPDLVITDVWSEDSTICYQIRNTGAALARAGHYAALLIDGVQEMLDYIAVDLAPGERLDKCFDCDWACTPAQDAVKVWADHGDDTAESDEANNCREETWKCDGTPPRIISGPTVSKITTNSAVVSWDTDEASDSAVTYDQAAGRYDFEKTASSLVTNHEIALTGLEPSTTYDFVVQSTDSSGNTVQSKDVAFETLAAPDDEDPVISAVDQADCTGLTTITAVVSDNIGVERVEFYLEGQRIYTDYSASSPFKIPWDPGQIPNGSYDLNVKAYDPYGNFVQMDRQVEVCNLPPDIVLPDVWFTNPKQGNTVSGNVTVAVEASDDFALHRVEFYVDDDYLGDDTTFPYTYLWDTRPWADGQQHIIKAIAYDTANNSQSRSIAVRVEQFVPPSPVIVLKNLDYTQHDNYFETVFEVHNTGTADATNVTIKICHRGFQCVSETDVRSPNNVVYDVEASYSVEDYTSCATITYDGTLGPGDSDEITVNIVPILCPWPYDPADYFYCIGEHYELDYPGAVTPTSIVANFHQGGNLAIYEIPVEPAVKSADYLIVTNPENLFLFNNSEADVNNLLSAMAELAMLKYGVLGYFYAPASFKADIGPSDLMVCGDVDGDDKADIIVASDADGKVRYYGHHPLVDETGRKNSFNTTYDGPEFETVFWHTLLDYGDGLACGDVDGDDRAEVIVAENSGPEAGRIDIYGYDTSTLRCHTEGYPLYTSFDDGDALACGDVDGDGVAEIIVADDETGVVDIYTIFAGGYREYYVPTSFEGYDLSPYGASYGRDGLTCGDVDGDGVAEIIVADAQNGDIDVYNTVGLEFSITSMSPYGYDAYLIPSQRDPAYNHDGLACGDVDGQGAAEIIVAEDMGSLAGRVDIWSSGTLSAGGVIRTSFGMYDHLACGDVDGDGQEEIIVADNEWGWIDVITYGRPFAGDRDRLRDLIERGGMWSSRLRDGWTSDGYLLIVGETEIIPAGTSEQDNDVLDFHEVVHCTDIKYANTAGAWYYPELNIGRIIGNRAANLIMPVEASIGVYQGLDGHRFDRSQALVVAGRGPSVTEFEKAADDVESILTDPFTVVKRKQRLVEDAGGNITAEFKGYANDKDVIFYTGHGGPYSWGHTTTVVTINDFYPTNTVNFVNTKPFVFAACCLSGQYAGIPGLAEAFLGHGAGAYIGATEVDFVDDANDAAKKFFDRWLNTDGTIGSVLKELKRDFAGGHWSKDRCYRRYWVSEFQLYGDPKYGGSSVATSSALMALTETEMQGPLSSLDVIVPDYEVTTVEGEDYIEIPDGDMFIVPGKPLVPFYTVSLNYPQGCQVQDVILTGMSGLTTATGLNIPNAVLGWDGEGSPEAMDGSEGPEWWPQDVSNWTVFENGDGSTTLAIAMCPFYYNPLTTDVRFYKNYSFDIDYTVSTVEISKLETDKHVYEQGEQVLVDMEISNSAAEAQDVLVDAVIEAESSGEIVGGLLLRTLKGLAGPASFSPHWDSTGFQPGYYCVKVTLKDAAGNVLDRKTGMFRLGVCSGEITGFTAAPESFDIGDELAISLAFNNIGTVDISGTALIRVQDESGDIVQEFSHNVTDLAPDDSINFDDSWDSSGAERGTYHISGLVFYDGQAAGLAITAITTAEPSDEQPSGGLCFIATAAYGTPMAEDIEVLREFRDGYLLTNPVGQALVEVYYEISPPIAELITEHPGLKPIVRAGLLPAVAMATVSVNTDPAKKMAIMGLLVFASVAVAVWLTRRRAKSQEYD